MRDAAEPNEYYGRTICFAVIDDERLRLGFTDGAEIDIWDADQTCCEYRHMTTDDDPQSLVGGVLTRIETKEGPNGPDGDCHEIVFLEVRTNKGFITIVNHNEHNGYYGGLTLSICEIRAGRKMTVNRSLGVRVLDID